MPRIRERKVRRVTVIGLGRFGRGVSRTLYELGYEVTAIDIDERQVESASDYVSLATHGDGTDEELLRSLQVERSDVVIVAQGSQLEASVLSTLVSKRLGVPWVVAKATSELHGEVLRRVGADRVIFPERDAGVRLAHTLAVPGVDDYISLSPTSGVAKIVAPPNLVGRSLAEAYEACGAHLSVVGLKRGRLLTMNPSLEERIEDRDEMVVIGPDEEIETFVEAGRTGPRQ
jgi:trk system potassium uptake protein TrkA